MNASQAIQLSRTHLPELMTLLEQLLAATDNEQDTTPNVVVYGVYNAGKSSLLNSLTGHLEHEFFATSDAPQTRTLQSKLHEGLCYIDTPGLDVNEDDDHTASKGVERADILILVHKLGCGPLQAAELATMKQRVTLSGGYQHVITVITEGELASRSSELVAEIKDQFASIAPGCAPFVVSNTSFRRGMLENKPLLVERSGMPALIEQLQRVGKQLCGQLQQLRTNKRTRLRADLRARLGLERSSAEQRLQQLAHQQRLHEGQLVSTVQALQHSLREGGLGANV